MKSIIPFALTVSSSLAKTVTYNFDIGWINAAPDGYERPVIAVNGQWPPPTIEADVGDTVVVNAKNSLGNETTGLHWHGQFQTGSATMDGPSNVNACPIPPGSSMTYSFTANPAGTYWWHSHNMGQYPDGLRGPMIIHDPEAEAKLGCHKEYTLTVSDWYHEQMPDLINYYLSNANLNATEGAEPIPKSSVVNDMKTVSFDLTPGEKYLFRMISMSALAAHYIHFDDHEFTVIAVDGVPVQPAKTEVVYISAAQRYDVIVEAKAKPTKNYALTAYMDSDMFDTIPNDLDQQSNGSLIYSSSFADPEPLTIDEGELKDKMLDDMTLVPADEMPLLGPVDQTITLTANFTAFSVGQRSALGKTPYIAPKVPTLYTALTTGPSAMNPEVYGETVNPYVLKYGQVIEVVLNNLDDGGHPFHLHGHHFQVAYRGDEQPYVGNGTLSPIPMRRDTVKVGPLGSLVLRWRADNPGIFLMHCHIEWHVEAGLSVTFIEAPDKMQEQGLTVPQDHLDACKALNIPTQGNCAGNTRDFTNTEQCEQPESWSTSNYGALFEQGGAKSKARRAQRIKRRQ